ncbi:MAG: hypothetical protein WCI49_00005 [Ferruginibacter sp.]
MPAKKIVPKKTASPKEMLINEITPLLTAALAKLKVTLGDKKFEKRIKKAAKFLVHGIKPVVAKKKVVKKRLLKKAVKKTAIPAVAKKAAKPKAKK